MTDLRKAAQQALDTWEASICAALRTALAQPEPPLSTGGWNCSEDGKQIFHDDFEFDAKLKVSGDFATDEQRIEFAKMVTKTLNGVLAQPEQEPVAWMSIDKHWMWSNKDKIPDRWIENVYPLYTAQPQRKPLTEAQVVSALRDADYSIITKGDTAKAMNIAHAIERAHGIGGKE
jgi:hypothetical protein